MTTPRPIANLIADRFVGHQVNLLRFAVGERTAIFDFLGQIQRDLQAKIIASDVDERTVFQERRLQALWKTADATIRTGYANIAAVHHERLAALAALVSDQTLKLTNAQIGVPLLTVGVPAATLKALVDKDLVLGLPAKDWWAKQVPTLKAAFQQTIRQGVFAGDTLGDLLRRVRGTRERRFQDGLMARFGRQAEALIRTSVQSVANAARYETLKANDDVLAGQQVFATLDGETCPICIVRDGFAWDFEGRPLNEKTKENFPGPPPWHFNDRCVLTPVLKSWEHLAREAKGNEKLARKLDRIEGQIGKGTQASMDGQVASDLTWEKWFDRRAETEQKQILGPGKWALWKSGDISLTDLVDQSGRPLTLEELRAAVA